MILAHLFMIGAFVWGMNRDASLHEAADQSARDSRTYFLIATQVIILFGYVYVIVIRPRLKKWGILQSASGIVGKKIKQYETVSCYQLSIGKTRLLNVSSDVYHSLEHGRHYTVYYTETLQGYHILSWKASSA